MSPIAPAPVFPSAKKGYDEKDEADFRDMVKKEIQRLRASIAGLPINSVFFSVRDYALPGTTDWKAAFEGADDDAVAADGIVLVPPGEYLISDSITMLAPILFAGGVVRPANTKTFTAENTATCLAGEWFSSVDGGIVTRPGGTTVPANQENGQVFDGSVTLGPNHYLRLDGNLSGNTHIRESSADVLDVTVGGGLILQLTSALAKILSGAHLQLGTAAAVQVAGVSTHKIEVKDNTNTSYYLLAMDS